MLTIIIAYVLINAFICYAYLQADEEKLDNISADAAIIELIFFPGVLIAYSIIDKRYLRGE